MKARLLTGLAALVLCTTACRDDETGFDENNRPAQTYTAVMEQSGNDARSEATETGKFTWTDGDNIRIITDSETYECALTPDETNAALATFTLDASKGNAVAAVYPSDVTATWDSEYALTAVTLPDTYGSASTAYSPSTHAVMMAEISNSDTQTTHFRHLGGVLRLTMTDIPEGATQFVFTATDKLITGKFTLKTDGEGYSYIEAKDLTDENGGGSSVTYHFASVTTTATFYVPLPVGTYSGFTIELKDKDGTVLYTRTSKRSQSIDRRTLALLSEPNAKGYTVSADGQTYTVFTAEGLLAVNAIAQGNPSIHITLGADITLPAPATEGGSNWTALGTSDKPYTGTFDGAGHTLSGVIIYKKASNQGLIGALGENAKVTNLTLSQCNIAGFANTGCIVGYNKGTISGCTVSNFTLTSTVTTATAINVGGIVGGNLSTGKVEGCTAIGGTLNNPNGSSNLGGIVGTNSGTVITCLAKNVTVAGSNDVEVLWEYKAISRG